ncbi:MAG: two-component sensor histidine kinase [Bacteroidia bacterium]|nr:two-component sensor histidine kinase [Bacteroidia bacterium]
MKARSRSIIILGILFGYILLQFLWWEILLVKQNDRIISEKQKLIELSSTNEAQLRQDLAVLHHKKKMQTVMIVSEGMVFLLLLLFGVYKIKQAVDKENDLNNQQKNFFLSVTHELKTPIAATKLQLQTLKKQKLDEGKQQELIGNALLETERLNMLIDNILLASNLENKDFIFNLEKVNITELTQNVLNRYYKNDLDAGHISMSLEENIMVAVDPNIFPSIIINLVDNALKYSPSLKHINIQLCRGEKSKVHLSVSDRGVGIDDKNKSRVFDKFYRIGNEDTRNTKGTGLGLFIVNYIVKIHNAKIGLKDNTPSGSVFEIEFYV